MKEYDIYFKLDSYSIFAITAKNKKEAKELALDLLIQMPIEELLERLSATISVDPTFKIIHIEEI